MKNRVLFVGLAFVTVAGCAKRPDAIVPVDIPVSAYENMTCVQITDELTKEQANLTALSKAQNDAATGDAVGVFLIGVPMSSAVGGDKEGVIAVSKGKVLSLQSSLKAKGC